MAVAVTRPREYLSNVQRVERAAKRIDWARRSLEAAVADLEEAGEVLATQAAEHVEAVQGLAQDVARRLPGVRR
jgi:hypothetical protein